VITERIKALSTSIVGGETNPVLASRKIYAGPAERGLLSRIRTPEGFTGGTRVLPLSKDGKLHRLSLALRLWRCRRVATRFYGSLLKPPERRAGGRHHHCSDPILRSQIGRAAGSTFAANIYAKPFPLTDKNEKLVELTTPPVTRPDASEVDYYFRSLDERSRGLVRWARLVMQPPQEDGPVNALTKAYVEVDGKQNSDDGYLV